MDARVFFLTELRNFCRRESFWAELAGFTWDDTVFFRTVTIRMEHGDDSAWTDFMARMAKRESLAASVRAQLESWGYLYYDSPTDRLLLGLLPPEIQPFPESDAEALLTCLRPAQERPSKPDQRPASDRDRKSAIMYIEYKGGDLIGPARIGRVTFSQSRKTLYYNTCRFKSLKGSGYKANYWDAENGGWYWISNCRSDGQDTLYPDRIDIDEDAREDYWTIIRNRPDLIDVCSFRSEGKYSKRRPQPDNPNHPASGPRS